MRYLLLILIATVAFAGGPGISVKQETCPCRGNTGADAAAPNWSADTRFKGNWNFDQVDQPQSVRACVSQPVLDNTPNRNRLTPASCGSGPNNVAVVAAAEGCRAYEMESSVGDIECELASGICAPGDMQIAGDFTSGCWIYPTGTVSAEQYHISTDEFNANVGSGYNLGINNTSPYQFIFQIDSGAGEIQVTSTTTENFSVWAHHVGRYTDSTRNMEQIINGILDATSGTANATPTTHDFFKIGLPGFSRSILGYYDDCFVFSGVLSDEDICRIAVCGVRGCDCACDSATPTNYSWYPKHTDQGGPLTCTLPACNKGAPS